MNFLTFLAVTAISATGVCASDLNEFKTDEVPVVPPLSEHSYPFTAPVLVDLTAADPVVDHEPAPGAVPLFDDPEEVKTAN